jgi:hypothetical protein
MHHMAQLGYLSVLNAVQRVSEKDTPLLEHLPKLLQLPQAQLITADQLHELLLSCATPAHVDCVGELLR